jgi:hypothetical protein
MIEFLPAPDHVVAMRLTGRLTVEEYDRVIAQVEARLGRHETIGLFVDTVGFEDISAEAALKDLRYGLGKIGQWKRFARGAVVTDRRWMRMLVGLADPLLPQMQIRAFEPSQRDEALAWAAAVPAA